MSALIVLLCCDLFLQLTGYQRGIYFDMLPLARLIDSPALVQIAFGQWFAVHGFPRLPLLFTCVPAMQRVALLHAVTTGHLALLCDLRLEDATDDLVHIAAAAGQLQVLCYLLSINFKAGLATAMEAAAANGHLKVVEYLHRHRTERQSYRVMDAAAANGHIHVVRFLHFFRREGCSTAAMDLAAANGHLDVVEFLHKYRPEGYSKAAISLAAANGHLHIVRFFVEHLHATWTSDTITKAASSGHLVILKYLNERKPRHGFTMQAMDVAATNGHFSLIIPV
ncbi:hypothetical protein AeNC1_006030 [Aphanomyces euteiches]|nr:hypothetical protein AeNC1_006030 [Aphanomyces euteiches]